MSIGSTIANLMALLSLDNDAFMQGVEDTLSSTDSFAGKLSQVGGGIVLGGLSAAGAAIGAIGAATWEAGNTMDAAMDMIQTKTGATSDTMQLLQQDFQNVFTNFPNDAEKTASVVATLNSRLDTTGPNLTNLAGPLLEVSRILGGDATQNAELFTRVMGDWSIPVDSASTSLDALFVAAQKTGAPIDNIMQQVVQFGAPLRQMGFGFEESAAMLGKWEKEGVNTELVLSSLRIASGKFAREGVDLRQGFWDTVDAIKNATSSSEALSIAMDTFGARSGPDMAAAIREGRFELGDLVDEMTNADGAILDTASATADWGESWQKFLNKVTARLAPLGMEMMDTAGQIVDAINNIFDRPEVQAGITQFAGFASQLISSFALAIPVVIDYIFQFVSFLQNNQGVVVGILAGLGVAVASFAGSVISAALATVGAMLPVILVMAAVGAAVYLVYEAWTNNWGGIRDTLMGVWANLQPTFDALQQWLSGAIPVAIEYLRTIWNNWIESAKIIWAFLQNYVFPVLGAVADVISAVLSVAFTALAGILQNVIVPALKNVWKWIDQNVMPVVRDLASWLSDKLAPAFKWVADGIGKVVDWLHDLADNLRNIHLPDWMTPGSPTPWEMGLRGVQDTLNNLTSTSLPRFEAAVALQTSPTDLGSVDIQPRSVPVDSGKTSQTDQAPENAINFSALQRAITAGVRDAILQSDRR